MPINLREADRDQLFLLPPSVADWLPENHLAFFVLDVVSELDLAAFYAEYREDGRGGAAYDPALVLAVLVYAYCIGKGSSRRNERRLVEDVAFRVVGANQLLDHTTLARFRRRHAEAIAGLFGQVLGLCVKEALVDSKVISIDGTKIEANASAWANRIRRQLADEIVAEAERGLVDPERAHLFDPVRVVHERCPVVARGRHHLAQETPSQRASEATDRATWPTARVHSRPARADSTRRSGSSSERSVQVSWGQLGSEQVKRRLDQTSRTRRLNAGRSLMITRSRILCPRDHATGRTPGHPTDPLSAYEQLIAVFGHRTTRNPRSPNSASRIRYRHPLSGALQFSRSSNNHENGGAPGRAGGYLSGRGQLFTRPSSLRRATLVAVSFSGAWYLFGSDLSSSASNAFAMSTGGAVISAYESISAEGVMTVPLQGYRTTGAVTATATSGLNAVLRYAPGP